MSIKEIRERCRCGAEFHIVVDGEENFLDVVRNALDHYHDWQDAHALACSVMAVQVEPRQKRIAEWNARAQEEESQRKAKQKEYQARAKAKRAVAASA